MKILENITSGYKRIATGIAIVLFLTVMYIALIPGASVAASGVYGALSGAPIADAFVKIVEWPQYNATTNGSGVYSITNVPIGTYNISATKYGYFPNTSQFTVVEGVNPPYDIMLFASKEFYFAEGYSSPTQQPYLTLQNPNTEPVNIIITYLLANGSTVQDTAVTVISPTTRVTARPYNFLSGAFSTKIISDKPIVAERPLYFNLNMLGGNVNGGHNTIGVTSPNTTWYFAEGYSSSTQQPFIPIMNPNNTVTALVTVTYMLSNGSTVVDTALTSIGPNTRATARPYNFLSGAFSTTIISDIPIVPERVMYFNLDMLGGNVNEGHVSIGTTSPYKNWYFAEGNNSAIQSTYIPILNPSNTNTANVIVTYLLPNGSTVVDTALTSIGPNTRATARPYNFVSGQHATNITSDQPIIAESVNYFRKTMLGGNIDGGYETMGASSLSTIIYFAEGYNSPTQQAEISIGNPNDQPASITITYMQPNGSTVVDTNTISVGATSRASAYPNNFVQGAFSTKIESTQPIVAERMVYFNLNMLGGNVNGAHNTIGINGPLS